MQSVTTAAPWCKPSKETRARLRSLANRITSSEHPDLQAVASLLHQISRGEPIATPHFPAVCTCEGRPCWRRTVHALTDADEYEDGSPLPCPHTTSGFSEAGRLCWRGCDRCEHVPIGCELCRPLVWVAWALGVAFAVDPPVDLGLPRSPGEDWQAEIMRRGRGDELPPVWAWWDDRDAEIYIATERRRYEERERLSYEIRFGTDRSKARRAERASVRKGLDFSCLIK